MVMRVVVVIDELRGRVLRWHKTHRQPAAEVAALAGLDARIEAGDTVAFYDAITECRNVLEEVCEQVDAALMERECGEEPGSLARLEQLRRENEWRSRAFEDAGGKAAAGTERQQEPR